MAKSKNWTKTLLYSGVIGLIVGKIFDLGVEDGKTIAYRDCTDKIIDAVKGASNSSNSEESSE